RRCGGLCLPHGGRRFVPGDGRGIYSGGRTEQWRGRLRRGVRALRAAADAVSEAQAAVGGEVRFVPCPEDGVRHSVPQPGRTADAAAAVRGGFLHRPLTAGSGPAPRLWVLTEG